MTWLVSSVFPAHERQESAARKTDMHGEKFNVDLRRQLSFTQFSTADHWRDVCAPV